MRGGRPVDEAAREAIRTRLHVSMLVEAAAGTGKTTALVQRMVNLVAEGIATPATIAAITFTVKAAAQLRERFQEEIEKRAAAAEGEDAARLAGGLALIDRGFIGTTHAFCARLLRERPVEAGLDPEFEELDDAAARWLTSEFWDRWYDAALAAGSAEIREARDIGLDRRALRLNFERLVEYPDVTIVAARTPRPDLAGLCATVMERIDAAASEMPDPIDEADKFQLLVVNLRRLRDSRDLEGDLDAQLQFLDEANHASVKPTQKRWPDKQVARRIGEDWSAFVTGTLRPELLRWQHHVHGEAIELLRPALSAFGAERRRNGTLTFQDLLTCARDMLRDHEPVRRYFQRRYTHLLVDEFQDTDPLQAEVMFYLTGTDVQERNWRRLRPGPGSLFIVGDPKQSIYRFRRADITTYLEVKERMDEIVELQTNFRSGPRICTFVNGTFRSLFTDDDVAARRQAKYIDLDPGGEDGPGVFRLEVPHDRSNDAVARLEAERLARWIASAVGDGSWRYRDFLLVAWQRSRLSFYASAMEKLGIPYEVTGSRAFGVVDDLRIAMPLLRAVAEPDDAVSLVAFLRGPLCGVDDDALYRFARAKGRFSPFVPAPEGSDARIVRGLDLVRRAVEDVASRPPAAAMARLFGEVGLLPRAVSHERAGTSGGNLLLAMSIARESSSRGEPFASIVAQFDDLLANPPDIEELDADPAGTDAVRLMNLHQVKGLEAPVVFLVDPADPYEFPVDHFIDRSGEESLGHFKVAKPWGKKPKDIGVPPGWSALEQREREFRAAQNQRLLYVAATRARKMLVVAYRSTAAGMAGAWRSLSARIPASLGELPGAPARAGEAAAIARGFREAEGEIEGRLEALRADTYSVVPVTRLAHREPRELVRAEEGLGRGTSWGRVLHRLFEAMLREPAVDLRFFAESLLKDEERDAAEIEEVMTAVSALRGSPLWTRVAAADEQYAEVPFAVNVPAPSLGLPFEGDTLLHGTIDLVFREGERWFIVDYKSDATAGAGRLDSLVEYYRPQVEHYARFWRDLTSVETVAGLFFVDGAVERWL